MDLTITTPAYLARGWPLTSARGLTNKQAKTSQARFNSFPLKFAAKLVVDMPALRQALGFSRGRSLALFILFGGAMSLFSILQLPFIDIDNVFCGKDPWATPGECYWFGRPGINKVAMRLHLATFLPAGALVGWQFVPASRRPHLSKYHRINGYVILGLSALGTVGALIIEKRAMGGPFSARIGTWIIGLSFTTAMVMGVVSIKKRQFEQHRAWMLRGWFYVSDFFALRCIPRRGLTCSRRAPS